MKVLVVMNASDVCLGGGIIQVIINYREQLLDKKIQFNFAINAKEDSGIPEVLSKYGEVFYQLPNKKKQLINYISTLYNICKKENYDVMHVHGNSASMGLELFIAKITKIRKRIAHCHNSKCSHPIMNRFLTPYFKKVFTDALACSELAGEWLFGKENFTVLYNAIELEKFQFNREVREKYRTMLNIDEDTVILGHVGNFNEQKNHTFLIDLFYEFQKQKRAILILIGQGPLIDEIKKRVTQFNISHKVFFLGMRNDVNCWLQAMDLFVLPSKWEGLPVILVEAQAGALPCIISDSISEEIKLTDGLKFLSLDNKLDNWINEIINSSESNRYNSDSFDKLMKSDYNIIIAANKLRKLYGVD